MSNRLSGKIALVTGGSRGIGAAIVRRLANEGAAVAFTYSASGERAVAFACSVQWRRRGCLKPILTLRRQRRRLRGQQAGG